MTKLSLTCSLRVCWEHHDTIFFSYQILLVLSCPHLLQESLASSSFIKIQKSRDDSNQKRLQLKSLELQSIYAGIKSNKKKY